MWRLELFWGSFPALAVQCHSWNAGKGKIITVDAIRPRIDKEGEGYVTAFFKGGPGVMHCRGATGDWEDFPCDVTLAEEEDRSVLHDILDPTFRHGVDGGKGGVILLGPTGAGKTWMFSGAEASSNVNGSERSKEGMVRWGLLRAWELAPKGLSMKVSVVQLCGKPNATDGSDFVDDLLGRKKTPDEQKAYQDELNAKFTRTVSY